MFHDWESVYKEQVLELLYDLKALFAKPGHWIYWPIAVDKTNLEVKPDSELAVKWSFLGACSKLTLAKYADPQASFINCATRDYLNSLCHEKLVKGLLTYEEEIELIELAILDLEDVK